MKRTIDLAKECLLFVALGFAETDALIGRGQHDLGSRAPDGLDQQELVAIGCGGREKKVEADDLGSSRVYGLDQARQEVAINR
jgi:hypothetical protein